MIKEFTSQSASQVIISYFSSKPQYPYPYSHTYISIIPFKIPSSNQTKTTLTMTTFLPSRRLPKSSLLVLILVHIYTFLFSSFGSFSTSSLFFYSNNSDASSSFHWNFPIVKIPIAQAYDYRTSTARGSSSRFACTNTSSSFSSLLSSSCSSPSVLKSNSILKLKLQSVPHIPRGGAAAAGNNSPSSRSAWTHKVSNHDNSSNSNSRQRRPSSIVLESSTNANIHTNTNTNTDTKDQLDAFLSRDSRQKFITRVYAILTSQLLVTSFITIFMNVNKHQILNAVLGSRHGRLIPLLSMALASIAWYTIALSERARHVAPLKWQLLVLFTLGESVLVGLIGCMYSFRTLLLAMGCTGAATGGITFYTMMQQNPKYDLTQWGLGLFSAGMVFVLLGLFQIFAPGLLQINDMLYSAAGAILFSFYLAYHTRLIVGGKHTKYKMNEKDYIFASMARKFITSIFILSFCFFKLIS